jgi:sugar lactone lactonase YvrE
MMPSVLRAQRVGSHRDRLGEGPAWDAQGRRLLWVDLLAGRVNELLHDGPGWTSGGGFELGRPVSAVLPCRGGGLLLTAGTELLHLADDGETSRWGGLDLEHPSARFNDAKCDPRGRLVAGWMIEENRSIWGGLCRFDPDRRLSPLLDDVGLANGMDWSPDGETFYFIDTLALRVDAFDYDLDTGTLSNRRALISIAAGEGSPDGMTVDDEGCLWVSVLFSGEVRRYAPDGELVGVVEVPTSQVTSVAFGGSDGGDLFVTSLAIDLPEYLLAAGHVGPETVSAVARDRDKGHLFTCRPGVAGPPATPFAN